MAQVRSAGGDYDTATRLLDQAEALYRPGFYPDVRPIAALKARVQIAEETCRRRADGPRIERSALMTNPTTCASTST